MRRDLSKVQEHLPVPWTEYGEDGEFFYPTEEWPWWLYCGQDATDPSVVEMRPPRSQPGDWLQWVAKPSEDDDLKMAIEWDGNEKFYNYVEWMKYIIDRIITPRGGVANGTIKWRGDDCYDIGSIVLHEDNTVKVEYECITYD